jgi:UDP-N-acetylglucosamine:LPS N-acetylglucosamine transferase
MKKRIEKTLTEKQERGLAILQQEPELLNELISEAIKNNEEKKMSPAQRLLREDIIQDLMEECGFSREDAEDLSCF